MTNQDNKLAQADPIFGFFRELSILEQLSRARIERALPDGMKASHFGVLNHLARVQKNTPANIADAFQVTRPSMTNTLQKLEAKQYIVIEADPDDGRGKIVCMTDKGLEARNLAIQLIAPVFSDIVENVGIDVFTSALPLLERVRLYMDKHR